MKLQGIMCHFAAAHILCNVVEHLPGRVWKKEGQSGVKYLCILVSPVPSLHRKHLASLTLKKANPSVYGER